MKNVSVGIPIMPDREKYVDKCIKSIFEQTYSKHYEVIIAQHPGFTYKIKSNIPDNLSIRFLDSGKPLSSKRNDIIKYALGKYIINIDDDIVAEPNWLENMMHAAIENDYDIFWGAAKPIYEKDFPESLDPFEMLIGGFHFDRKGNLRRKGLIGCNFGFRNGLNHKRGKFVETIGRGGAAIRDGEEILFMAECINPKSGFIKNSIVNHHIQSSRINFSYILKNRCSNVKARIFINNIIGESNRSYLFNRVKSFIKAFIPKNHLIKTIVLEYSVLKTTILSIASMFFNKSTVDDF